MPVTVVFLHAHPDDEALLTGGTMARLSAEGHRVVLITATDGAAGLATSDEVEGNNLASIRASELLKSAEALGVSRAIQLGYSDSGLDGMGTSSTTGGASAAGQPFAQVPLEESAGSVADILREENARVLVGYDKSGGYGHPDHVRVHYVAKLAAQIAGTPLLLEATMPREPWQRTMRTVYSMRYLVPPIKQLDMDAWNNAYVPRKLITHRVDVRQYLPQKREALAAHASQAGADSGPRTLSVLLKLPKPAFAKLLGHEFFLGPEHGHVGFYSHPLSTIGDA